MNKKTLERSLMFMDEGIVHISINGKTVPLTKIQNAQDGRLILSSDLEPYPTLTGNDIKRILKSLPSVRPRYYG